jgi:hypothetical protein
MDKIEEKQKNLTEEMENGTRARELAQSILKGHKLNTSEIQ